MLISAGNIISQSIKLYRENIELFLRYAGLLYIATVILALTGILTMTDSTRSSGMMIYFIIAIFTSVASIWISIAFIRTMTARYEGKNPLPIKEELNKATKLILPAILVSILTALAVIIPGIIFMIWFSFAYYCLILDDKHGVEALKTSKKLVEGRWFGILWRLLAPGFVFAILTAIIQFIVAIPLSPLAENFKLGGIVLVLITTAISMLLVPLSSAAPTILYLEMRKNPVKKA